MTGTDSAQGGPTAAPQLGLSVIVPVLDEADNILPLVAEFATALAEVGTFEVIYVDDGSRDGTAARLAEARASHPFLRCLSHAERCGKSQAIRTGVEAARGELIAVLDGDGQNDPADLPAMLGTYRGANPPDAPPSPVAMVAGRRMIRHDSAIRRLSSRLANAVRRSLLHDGNLDSGCAYILLRRETYLRLPYFEHMHRFMAALVQREGLQVVSQPVHHRPRQRGRSKFGVHNRLWVGIVDMFGVLWLQRRMRRPSAISES